MLEGEVQAIVDLFRLDDPRLERLVESDERPIGIERQGTSYSRHGSSPRSIRSRVLDALMQPTPA